MAEDAAGPAASTLVVSSARCATLRDEQFGVVWRTDALPDDFPADNFDFTRLVSSGGKGGDAMERTLDRRFFVKTLSDADGRSLLEDAFLRAYVRGATARRNLATRICALFTHP